MWWLALVACSSPAPRGPAAVDGDGAPPPSWWWVTGDGFEAAFPEVPSVADAVEHLDLGGGPTALPARRYQVVSGTSSFTVAIVDLPEGTSPDLSRWMEARAAAMSAALADRGAWTAAGFEVAEQARVETGRPGDSLLRMGLDDGDLWIVQGIGDRAGPGSRFVGSFRRVEAAPQRAELGAGAVRCPARCGPSEEQVQLAGGLEPLPTLRGVLGAARFEAVGLRIPAGVPAEAALEALEQRAVRRSRGRVASETEGADGKVLEIGAGRGRTRVRLVASPDTAYALEVSAPDGREPEWAASFLASLEM